MTRRFPAPGSFKSADRFFAHLQEIDPKFHCDLQVDAAGPLARSLEVYGRIVGNRFAIHPMEGWDATLDGAPSEHTRRRWRHFGESGAGLIWGGEAIAVRNDGRANPNQLFINPNVDNTRVFADLRQELVSAHQTKFGTDSCPLIGLQLTHSGRFSRPNHKVLEPKIAFYHPLYSEKYNLPADYPVLSDGELEQIRDDFVAAAKVAQAAGFEFVDIKSCHAYLIHELLSAFTRPGKYGGDFENRTRFFREVVAGIRAECPGLEVGVRLGLTDLPPHVPGEEGVGQPMEYLDRLPWRLGFGMDPTDPMQPDWREPLEFLRLLESLGIRLVNISIGTPYGSAHLQRPAAFPPSDGYWPPVDPLVSVFRQLQAVRVVKTQLPDMIVVGTGYSYLQDYLPHVAQYEVRQGNVDFVGLGRMVLSYPELPADVLAGRPLRRKRICRTFSDCTTGPRNHLLSGCFPLDDYYKEMPEAKIVKRKRSEKMQSVSSSKES